VRIALPDDGLSIAQILVIAIERFPGLIEIALRKQHQMILHNRQCQTTRDKWYFDKTIDLQGQAF